MKDKKSVSIFIILLIAAVLTGCATAKNYTPDEYLKQNHEEINFNSKYKDYFKILNNDVNKYDIFLTGEAHATKANLDLQLAFIEYFNKKAGVRDILSESSYSEAEYINQYLETGNEAKLNIVFDSLKGTLDWSKESVEFYKKLRQYDMSLPEDKRVKLVGIDIEHQLDVAVYYLRSITPNNLYYSKPGKTIRKLNNIVNHIKHIDGKLERKKQMQIYVKQFKTDAQLLKEDIKNNKTEYKQYLGKRFFDFSIVTDNIQNSINAYANNEADFNKVRERSIYENFMRIHKYRPVNKYYGEFGGAHVIQKVSDSDDYPLKNSFAMRLNGKNSIYKNKVISIMYYYENCSYSDSSNKYRATGMQDDYKDVSMINKYSNSDMCMFKLNGSQSPFNKKAYFINNPTGGATTDYMQYIVLIKNSEATTPLEPQ